MEKKNLFQNNFFSETSNVQIQQNTNNSIPLANNAFSENELLSCLYQLNQLIPKLSLSQKKEAEMLKLSNDVINDIKENKEISWIQKGLSLLNNTLSQTGANLASTGILHILSKYLS